MALLKDLLMIKNTAKVEKTLTNYHSFSKNPYKLLYLM